jgi:dTDP-4-dehydrorhamnose reductase
VGGKLVDASLLAGDEVHAAYVTRPPIQNVRSSHLLDKTKRDQVMELVEKVRPEVVFDTGALQNVDYCEANPQEALAVNRDGTRNLAEACSLYGARFIFVSTDYVFDGEGGPYSEDDAANPVNAYGLSKLEGERAALEACAGCVVVRPSVVYSWVAPGDGGASSSGKPLNFGAWLIRQLQTGKQLTIVDDQFGSPTLADDLASAMMALASSSASGVVHTAGSTVLSRYEFALRMAKAVGLDESLLHPVKSSQFKQAARRPANCALISEKLRIVAGHRMMEIDEALLAFARYMRGGST